MNSPIKAGDLCKVISGMSGEASPNIGLVVQVISFRGEHSLHGRIWRCEAAYVELGQPGINSPYGTADFAQSWLKKIEPPPQSKTVETTTTKETTS